MLLVIAMVMLVLVSAEPGQRLGYWQEAVWDGIHQSLWRVNELGSGCLWPPKGMKEPELCAVSWASDFYELYKWRMTDMLSIMV